MLRYIRIILIIITCLVYTCCYAMANRKADSLAALLPAADDSLKMVLYEEIASSYVGNRPDTAMIYTDSAMFLAIKNNNKTHKAFCWNQKGDAYTYLSKYDEAMNCYEKSYVLYEMIQDTKSYCNVRSNIALTHYYQGNYEQTIDNYMKSVSLKEIIGNYAGIANDCNNLGIVYRILGQYDSAVAYQYKSLRAREELNDTSGMISSFNNLGIIFESLENHTESIEHFEKAMKLCERLNEESSIAYISNNIGSIYLNTKDYANAMIYLEKGLEIYEKLGDMYSKAPILANIGMVYEGTGKYPKALDFYMKSLDIRRKIDDLRGESLTLNCVGSVLSEMKRFDEAIIYLKEGLVIAEKLNDREILMQAYEELYNAYTYSGNCEKAYEYNMLFNEVRDSIFQINNAEVVAEISTKYETEKKEQEIVLLNKEKELQENKIMQQRTVAVATFIGLTLVVLLALAILVAYILKRRANKELSFQKEQILEKNEELNQQNEEIAAQRDEIDKQKNFLEEYTVEVNDSIEYAQRIQTAVLPDNDRIKELLNDHFILYIPKNIVSGDFYWTRLVGYQVEGKKQFAKKTIVAVADCTGHGVPGAFMSMLGIALLNEIMNFINPETVKANDILELLRQNVIKALHQTGKQGEQTDGMDISLCIIEDKYHEQNPGEIKVSYSGANNPLYVISENASITLTDNVIKRADNFTEIKGDKQPISIYPKMYDFSNHEFILNSGDCIYMFSDGFADQIGGEKGKKFKYKAFRELIHEISYAPMMTQKIILEERFNKWIGWSHPLTGKANDQIDDICVIGLRMPA